MTADLQRIQKGYVRKKVFVTGHTGFKGSWLLSWLSVLNAEVKGYALAAQEQTLYKQIHGDSLCQSVEGDIRDAAKLRKEIMDFQPDFVFHFAAQSLVRISYAEPLETFATNIMGTANVLEAIRLLKKPCVVVVITTDKVYENREWVYPYRECEALGGYDPYSASKAASEIVVSSYRNSFFNPSRYADHLKSVASARAGNVIGGGDWAKDRIIPDLARAFSKNEPLVVRNRYSIRPWQHVLEPLRGYLLLALKMEENPTEFSEAWNFGPNANDNITVGRLVEIASQQWAGAKVLFQEQDHTALHEAAILKLDVSKALDRLNWFPLYSVKDSIRLTVDWYIEFFKGVEALKLIDKDLRNYMSVDNEN